MRKQSRRARCGWKNGSRFSGTKLRKFLRQRTSLFFIKTFFTWTIMTCLTVWSILQQLQVRPSTPRSRNFPSRILPSSWCAASTKLFLEKERTNVPVLRFRNSFPITFNSRWNYKEVANSDRCSARFSPPDIASKLYHAPFLLTANFKRQFFGAGPARKYPKTTFLPFVW